MKNPTNKAKTLYFVALLSIAIGIGMFETPAHGFIFFGVATVISIFGNWLWWNHD